MERILGYILRVTVWVMIPASIGFSQETPDEIVFHSNGSSFSPLILVDGAPEVLWTFHDGTTSTSTNPSKDYGSYQLRRNRLKVTPWSAIRAINIGYDAGDGGSDTISLVPDQHVSHVENLHLAAPSLQLWCSSYNQLDTLLFDDFVNLKTVECYLSRTIRKVSLRNTPSLERLCLEDNDLDSLDVSDCVSLADLRGASNRYSNIGFSNSTEELWHICVRDNLYITNPSIFAHMEDFPAIAELLIWNANQSGTFEIHHTSANVIYFQAWDNEYSTLDVSRALQFDGGTADVDFSNNMLSSVNVEGCIQISYLNLRNNLLSVDSVDKVLRQLDELDTYHHTVDLRGNAVPSALGLQHKSNLEAKQWIVRVQTTCEMQIFGNSSPIADGSTVPSVANHTDFGFAHISGGTVTRLFTIQNIGSGSLNLTGAPRVAISGAHASDFAVTQQPGTPVSPLTGSTTFLVTFNPSAVGIRQAVVSIANDDVDENPYDFVIRGEGRTASIQFTDGLTFMQDPEPGSANQALGRFELSADIAGAVLDSVTIRIDGTRTGVSNLRLWQSDDSTFDPLADRQQGNLIPLDPGDGGVVAFGGLIDSIETTACYYFLTADLEVNAHGTMRCILEKNARIVIVGGSISGIIADAPLSGNEAPLPVELACFTVQPQGSRIMLHWRTASEVDCAGFEIERKSLATGETEEAAGWSMVGSITGQGLSFREHEYEFVDRVQREGRYLYRLKQLDVRGSYQYSQEVEVLATLPRDLHLAQNHPNPFNPSTSMEFLVPIGGPTRLTIFNSTGQEIARLFDGPAEAGRVYHVTFEAARFPSGIYLARLSCSSGARVIRMMLLK